MPQSLHGAYDAMYFSNFNKCILAPAARVFPPFHQVRSDQLKDSSGSRTGGFVVCELIGQSNERIYHAFLATQ